MVPPKTRRQSNIRKNLGLFNKERFDERSVAKLSFMGGLLGKNRAYGAL
jgi:hypothetical protein